MRSVKRPRRYVPRYWLVILRPLLRFSLTRNAYVLRGIGRRAGPVMRPDRRRRKRRTYDGIDRRRAQAA
jgi:hypothetical protein